MTNVDPADGFVGASICLAIWDPDDQQRTQLLRHREVHLPGFPPRPDGASDGEPLRLRGVNDKKGMGLRAPSHLIYEVKPEFDRFVARAGVDEGLLKNDLGRERAMYPHVIFKVVMDGRIVAESPVLRISQEPWRFNVPIPPGSRVISLAAAPVIEFNPGELVQWLDAGFTLNPGAAWIAPENRHQAVGKTVKEVIP